VPYILDEVSQMKLNIFGFSILLFFAGCKHSPAEHPTSSEQFNFFKPKEEKFKTHDGTQISLHDYSLTSDVTQKVKQILKTHFGLRELKKQPSYKKAEQNGLNEIEATSLIYYTGGGARLFGEWLNDRAMNSEDDDLSSIDIESLFLGTVAGLNKLPASDSRLYFGAVLPERYFKDNIQKGKFWSNSNFTSTSTDREVAEKFATGIKEDSDKKCIFVIDKSTLGRKIDEFSIYPEEKEVLYLPLQKFRIIATSSEKKDGHDFNLIQMEEVLPKK
jgi:hypothetical protein